jgi:chondroitin AC lyase
VSDGLNGAAVMDYAKAGVHAKKGYFFTPQGIVCLGTGITSEEPDRVLTTLNQCRLKSDISVLRQGKVESVPGGHLEASDIQAVHHESVAYVMIEGALLEIHGVQQTGSWRLVEAGASDEPVPEDVFTCFIDHGAKPTQGSYAYMMVPGASKEDLSGLSAHPPVDILANTPECQAIAVSSESLAQAIFHSPGSLDLPSGGHLGVDAASAVQLQTVGDGEVLTVADPTQELRQLTVTIDGRWKGRGASYVPSDHTTHIVVLLPEGAYAGQSVSVHLARP